MSDKEIGQREESQAGPPVVPEVKQIKITAYG